MLCLMQLSRWWRTATLASFSLLMLALWRGESCPGSRLGYSMYRYLLRASPSTVSPTNSSRWYDLNDSPLLLLLLLQQEECVSASSRSDLSLNLQESIFSTALIVDDAMLVFASWCGFFLLQMHDFITKKAKPNQKQKLSAGLQGDDSSSSMDKRESMIPCTEFLIDQLAN